MNQTWDLSVLYKDFDDPAYAADMAALDAAIAALHELAEEAGTLSASELTHRYADAGDAFVALESKLYIYASLRYSADTGNTAAASTVGRVMDRASAAVADDTRIREAIAAIGHDRLEELLSADPTLGEYAYLFRSILKDSRYRLSDREEALIAKMNLSGADAWENLQSSLTSSAKVLYRGQTITLSDVRNLAYDADPAVRRDAYDAEIACYEPIRDAVGLCHEQSQAADNQRVRPARLFFAAGSSTPRFAHEAGNTGRPAFGYAGVPAGVLEVPASQIRLPGTRWRTAVVGYVCPDREERCRVHDRIRTGLPVAGLFRI